MRERAALILLVASLILIVCIDITPHLMEAPFPMEYIESSVDALTVILIYILLKRELNFRTRVLNMAAHDLRNPLGIIRGYAEIFLEKTNIAPDERDILLRIHAKADEMLLLVSDLLDSAVLERNAVSLERKPLSLRSLLLESVAGFETQALAKDQRLIIQAEEDFQVMVDPSRMKQVLNNLISNALKFSPNHSAVHLTLEGKHHKVRLSVCDQGPGLSSSESEHIFDSFSKVKKRPTGGESSTGLGLSITKSLVALNGGKVWVESEGEGRGSTFIVELPQLQS